MPTVRESALVPDPDATEIRGAHRAAKDGAGVGGQFMPLLENRAIYGRFSIRIEQHEVSVAARADSALPISEPTEAGRALAHPPPEVGEREPAARSLGPYGSQ